MVAFQLTALVCFVTAFEVGHVDAFRSDYTLIESTDSYYKLYSKRTNWTDAKAQCESDGATMFHPNNEAELLDVFRLLDVKKEMGWMHTGMTNLDSPDVFKTVDGRLESHVYNKWDSDEPREPNERHCVILYRHDHKMQTSACFIRWPFICKLTTEIKTILEIADNMSLRIDNLERQVINKTAELKQQNEYHFSILERLMEADVNQSAALEQFFKADTKQAADIKIQIEAINITVRTN